jgi:hypothetical protein
VQVFALVLALLAFELLASARILGGLAWLASWPALSLLVVAAAYGFERPQWLGKTGPKLSTTSRWLLFPYLVVQHGLWHWLRVTSREPPFALLDDGVVIGRRLRDHEYPPDLASVVDLTSEFSECLPEARALLYLNVPILDGGKLEPAALDAALERIGSLPRPLYLHCALGHGRTGMVAACLLIALGRAGSASDALARVRAARPRARLNRRQREAVEQLFARTRTR